MTCTVQRGQFYNTCMRENMWRTIKNRQGSKFKKFNKADKGLMND